MTRSLRSPSSNVNLQELLALLHGFAGLDLHHAEIALGGGVKVHVIREQRLDLHLAEINRGLFDFLRRVLFLGLGLGFILGGRRGGSVQRLHRRDFKLTLFANQFFLIYLYSQNTFFFIHTVLLRQFTYPLFHLAYQSA